MKILVSISELIKTKKGSKSEIYIIAGAADKNPANDAEQPLTTGGSVATEGGVQIITTAVYTGIKQGGSLNLAGIGIPLYHGDPAGALAIDYRFMESDSKERVWGKVAQAMIDEGLVQDGIAAVAGLASPLIGAALTPLFFKIAEMLRDNGDDDFGGGSYSSVGPRYDIEAGETVRLYPISTNEMRGQLRVELVVE
jgi:hypothetical protein